VGIGGEHHCLPPPTDWFSLFSGITALSYEPWMLKPISAQLQFLELESMLWGQQWLLYQGFYFEGFGGIFNRRSFVCARLSACV
jgi:hypothetical protein